MSALSKDVECCANPCLGLVVKLFSVALFVLAKRVTIPTIEVVPANLRSIRMSREKDTGSVFGVKQ